MYGHVRVLDMLFFGVYALPRVCTSSWKHVWGQGIELVVNKVWFFNCLPPVVLFLAT